MGGNAFDMGGMMDEETMMHMMMGGGDPSAMFAQMPGMKMGAKEAGGWETDSDDEQ
jgi:hypothetical protein